MSAPAPLNSESAPSDALKSRASSETLSGEGLDRFGAVASSLCAVHCAVCALLPAAFGALGLGALLGHEAEWVFTIVAVIFAGSALFLSWRRHRSGLVAGLLIAGIVGLIGSRMLEMGGGHAGHHDEPAHAAHHDEPAHEAAKSTAAHAEETHAGPPNADHGAEEAHGDASHMAGTLVGVLAGLLLLCGHLLNIQTSRRRRRKSCCE